MIAASPLVFPPTGAWDELRAAAPLSLWEEAARRIVAAHGLPDGAPEMYPTGSDVVMRVGEVVVKLSSPRWAAEIGAEAALLSRVEGRLPLQTPRLLARGELHGWPYVVMSRVDGLSLASVWGSLGHEERLHVALGIGELMRALAALPVPAEDAAAWAPFLAEHRANATARLGGRRRAPPLSWVAQVEPFLTSVSLSSRPLVWMHTELLGEHLLVREVAGRWRLAAVIDFADGRVGHPFYELPGIVEFLFRGEPGLLRALLLSLGVPAGELGPALSRELCAWGLLHRFGDLARARDAAGPPPPDDLDALAERLYGL